MSHRQHMFLCVLVFYITVPFVRISGQTPKFNITLKTPGNTSPPTTTPHKSIRVAYALSDEESRWIIVGIEPVIQIHRKAIEELTVHLCDRFMLSTISYDENIICEDGQSMLIYEWTPHSSMLPFRSSESSGFDLTKFKTIILTVIYKKEKQVHKEQSGVILHVSNQPPRLLMSTMIVGDEQRHTQFSCHSSNVPRLLYGIKKLESDENKKDRWRIYVIRFRQLRRNLIQSVLDSTAVSNTNQSTIEILAPDIFLMDNDYLLIECQNTSEANCYFLIYYIYKSRSIRHENICDKNEYPDLFKHLPSIDTLNINDSTKNLSNSSGPSIFTIIFVILLFIWISIIIGCIIWRRFRGLVNFRTESASPFSLQKKNIQSTGRTGNDNYYQRQGEADQAMQIEAEHAMVANL